MAGGARGDDGGARRQTTTVFVSDPSAEAERVSQALRCAGFGVVDVPLSMLVARVAVQRPRVILIDADGEGALDAAGRMRDLPDADDIDVLFLARPGGAVSTPEDALLHEGSGLFIRPVDVPALVRKVEVLTGALDDPPAAPPAADAGSALPPPSMRALPVVPVTPLPPPPGRTYPARTGSEPPKVGEVMRPVSAPAPPVSSELQQLLSEAELRVQIRAETESMLPTPEDEIEAVLPAELLAALDEPLEPGDEDDEAPAPAGPSRGSHHSQVGQVARDRVNDGGAVRPIGASAGGATPSAHLAAHVEDRPGGSLGQAHTQTPSPTHAGGTGGGVSTTGGADARADSAATSAHTGSGGTGPRSTWSDESAAVPRAVEAGASTEARGRPPVGANAALPSVLGAGDAMQAAARAIASRTGGSLCFIDGSVERRVVLREGDIVTVASTAEDESLLAFLGTRGELPRETVRRLSTKFPAFGRHAGAALVARGYLGQDQMWPALRAHAEWVFGRVLQMQSGSLLVEARPPGRLAGEPSVFGGSPGAEVFVELVRRLVAPVDAVERLGGVNVRLGPGRRATLLGECTLAQDELDRMRAASAGTLRDLLDSASEGDLATVVFALAQLEVLDVIASMSDRSVETPEASPDDAALDAEAIRERVRARSQLVDDGDYFAVLGVARNATGYEVRRAFLELRRAFDPSRMLTPEVADLAGDVRKITVVLEEAYEILKDTARRDRYRRAIEAVPDGA